MNVLNPSGGAALVFDLGEINGERLLVLSARELMLLLERERQETAKLVREEVRKALFDAQDRQSFAAANDWLTLEQVEELLGRSRTYVESRLSMRKLAKTVGERDAAFAPVYQEKRGGRRRFKRSEVEAWQRSHGR
jgi:predicted DNA-binding transcriptional regulator AlpA